MRHATLADEDWRPAFEVDGLDVDVRLMAKRLAKLGATGRPEAFGPCGVDMRLYASSGVCVGSVIVTQAEHNGAEWIHASIAREKYMPTYGDLTALKEAVFGPERFAFQVFPPASDHVNIHERALHLWGRADGVSPLPRFGQDGTI